MGDTPDVDLTYVSHRCVRHEDACPHRVDGWPPAHACCCPLLCSSVLASQPAAAAAPHAGHCSCEASSCQPAVVLCCKSISEHLSRAGMRGLAATTAAAATGGSLLTSLVLSTWRWLASRLTPWMDTTPTKR